MRDSTIAAHAPATSTPADRYAGGFAFLMSQHRDGRFPCLVGTNRKMTDAMRAPQEAATSLLVLDMVLRHCVGGQVGRAVVEYVTQHIDSLGRFPFFEDPDLLPTDTETTGFALALLLELGLRDKDQCLDVAEQMRQSLTPEGLLPVYFEPAPRQQRLEHVCATNAMLFMHTVGEGDVTEETERWVLRQLTSGQYVEGSRYYPSPEAFLYFLSRACSKVPRLQRIFTEPLRNELRKSSGSLTRPIDLAMRISGLWRLGMNAKAERARLLKMQRCDGAWPANYLFKYGSSERYLGSPVITTAFALEALCVPSTSEVARPASGICAVAQVSSQRRRCDE